MSARPYACTATTLVLHEPISALTQPARTALQRWAHEHGVPLTKLAVGHPIERDDVVRSLRWREVDDDTVFVHVRFPAFAPGDEPWPRPFPDALVNTEGPGRAVTQ